MATQNQGWISARETWRYPKGVERKLKCKRNDSLCGGTVIYGGDKRLFRAGLYGEYWYPHDDTDKWQEYKPAWVEANLRGVLVAIKDNSTGTVSINFISVGKLKQIAGVSPSVKKGSYSPYTEWGLEMYQGKAIKYILSKTPMNEQIGRAVEIDNQLDMKAIEDKKETSAAIDIDLNAMLAEQPINVEAQEIKDDDIKA